MMPETSLNKPPPVIAASTPKLFAKPLSLSAQKALMGYLFVAPQMLGFLIFVLGPTLAIFVFSFQKWNLLAGTTELVGLQNYQIMLGSDRLFSKVLVNSLVFSAGLVPINVVLAFVLAFLLTHPIKGVSLFRTLYFAPVVTSAVAWAIVWKFMLQGEQGTVNQMLSVVGIEGPNWLRESGWAMFSVIVTRVFKNVGLNIIIFMAAIQNLPQEYDEAAQMDGAGWWQRFWQIMIPLLSPTILLVTVITIIGSLKIFDHIMLMTGGGPANTTMVLVYYVWFKAFKTFEFGYASALAIVLFVISLAATLAQWGLRRRFVHYEN